MKELMLRRPFDCKVIKMMKLVVILSLTNIRQNPISRTGEVRLARKMAYYVEPIVPENKDSTEC